ncbi:hypothetical protein [Prescottella equi]|uniref:NHL repeat containing protein n=1 Tax=Rhodococcus hoagii TaxID=43767 RepID=A0AAP2F5Y7_RHOHA|nr:hypothetical protein [Prescottella equi]MBM4627322.1 hypothetical protein [Prescottella equi]QPQ78940.1 hypothetical protein I6H09_09315 [Prescottella equi]SUE03409.1 serine/threonine protein kinase [Prescottella equi]SUE21520.1 serine/threonine protein kinase [Prescottella equi]BDC70395.1 hypothetical protein KAREA_03100 [Prescottella equi]
MASHGLTKLLLSTAAATAVVLGAAAPAYAVDPPATTYTQSTVLALRGGEWANDVAVDDYGNTAILVSSPSGGGTRVVKISKEGQQTSVPITGQRSSAGSLAIDSEGNTFLTFGSYLAGGTVASGSVLQITPEGNTFSILYGMRNPCDVTAKGTEIAVLDCGTGNEDGQVVRADIPGGSASQWVNGFVQPRGIALDNAGNIFVGEARYGDGNSSVAKVARDGSKTEIPLAGIFPHGVAIGADGNPVVAGVTETAVRVVRLSADGTQTVLPFSGLVWPTGVAANQDGAVTVSYLEGSSTNSASRVVRLTPNPVSTPTPEPTPTPTPGFGSSGS